MDERDLRYRDQVTIQWGLQQVDGVVDRIYGPAGRRHVVVLLTPEVTGLDVVDKETTVSLPIERIEKHGAA